jgi:hypothetical protein
MSQKTRSQLVSSMFRRFHGRAIGLVIVLPFVAGCGHPSGPPRAAVHGEVILDESPLKSGVIRFVPTGATKGPVALATIKDGRYDLSLCDGPALGDNAVEIVPGIDENPLDGATDIRAAWAEYAKTTARNRERATPKKIKSSSDLKVHVQAKAKNTFDFTLASQ